MASDVPAGTLTFTAGGGGAEPVMAWSEAGGAAGPLMAWFAGGAGPAIMALLGSGEPFVAAGGAPTGVTTGLVGAGFGPGAGGVIWLVTCCV